MLTNKLPLPAIAHVIIDDSLLHYVVITKVKDDTVVVLSLIHILEQMVNREGVTEQLKMENQMEWVGKMNNIHSRSIEIVNAELIYS